MPIINDAYFLENSGLPFKKRYNNLEPYNKFLESANDNKHFSPQTPEPSPLVYYN